MKNDKNPLELTKLFKLAEPFELNVSFEKRTFYAENQTLIYKNYITKLPSIFELEPNTFEFILGGRKKWKI